MSSYCILTLSTIYYEPHTLHDHISQWREGSLDMRTGDRFHMSKQILRKKWQSCVVGPPNLNQDLSLMTRGVMGAHMWL